MFQVEERRFYLRLVSSKGEGVAVSLYRALESLASFDVQNFNFATEPERLVLTFNLNVIPSSPFPCFYFLFFKSIRNR